MPRSFDMATEYEGTSAQVYAAFREKQYWLARLAASGADDATLEAFRVGDDGGIDVVTTQVLRATRLPGIVHQFHHGDLEIRRAETWSGLADGGSAASIAGSIVRAPVVLDGSALLSPLDERAVLTFQATVEVRIPLVGGKMEKFIGTQLVNLLTSERQFTTRWIAENL